MKTRTNQGKHLLGGILGAVLLFLSLLPSTGLAVTPAGTVIGNQATATYQDASQNSFTTQSNVFSVTVSQVAGVSMSPGVTGTTLSGVLGNQVQFPHTVKNTGNGTDTFTLTPTTGGEFTLGSIAIFRDDNGDGLASAGEPAITSISLPMDGSQMIVVRGTIPISATDGQSGTITVTATSQQPSAPTASSTDTAKATSAAVISLSKVVSAASVNPNGTLDYTINYTNTGNASTGGVPVTLNTSSATRHVVRDELSATTTFLMFLGAPSQAFKEKVYHDKDDALHVYTTTPPVPLTDLDAVAYLFDTPMVSGQSGAFSFRVTVKGSAPVGTINNTSVMTFNNGSSPTNITNQTSNTTVTSVNLVAAVDLYDTDAGLPNIQEAPSGDAGSSVTFTNEVKNNGNGPDRFNITVSNVSFPSGTVFTLLKGDGVTPLLDSNSDGIVDTGLLGAAATMPIILKATLPANASSSSFVEATVTATSVADPGKVDSVTDRLNAIVPAKVDVTNDSTSGPGGGAGPEGNHVKEVLGDPGATVNVDLHVKNMGPNMDNFDLKFSNDGVATHTGTLPTGITAITFLKGNGFGSPILGGAPITNTGSIGSNVDQEIIAQVTISASVAGGTNIELYFHGTSPSSGAVDVIHDRVTVNTIRGITLQQNQSNQTSPGGAVLYPHILKNTGNVTEPSITLMATNTLSGFVSTIYLDSTGNGLDGTDAIISSVSNLAAGASKNLIVRVAAPSSATNGAVDTMTFTATPTETVNLVPAPSAVSNTDTTTIVTGQIQLTLSGAPSSPQPPGATITYTITYTNIGAATSTDVVVTNAIPVNTTYVEAVPPSLFGSMKLGSTPLTDALDGDAGTLIGGTKGSVRFKIGTVASGGTGTVSFQVKID